MIKKQNYYSSFIKNNKNNNNKNYIIVDIAVADCQITAAKPAQSNQILCRMEMLKKRYGGFPRVVVKITLNLYSILQSGW
jgi:hypothetical protein